jgi:hypothetical protein
MAKQSVVVDGVILTRAQVDEAARKLAEPDINPGDIVRSSVLRGEYMVLGGSLHPVFSQRYYTLKPGYVWVTNGMSLWDQKIESLTKVRSLVQT